MSRIAVITDSAACIPPDLVKAYGIRVVPFGLVWGQQTYRDGVDIKAAEFYQRLRTAERLPTTSQPTIADFVTVYRAAATEAEGAVSLHVPQSMSGAVVAARHAAGLLPQFPVRVIDCGTAVMAQGFIAIAAAQAAAAGASLDEVAKAAKAMIPRVNLYATLETLQYLARSGRVPAALALLGAALQVQPVFTIKNGTVDLIARVRTRTRAIEHIVECVAAHVDGGALHAAVFHADVPHDAEALAQELRQHFACRELLTTEFTPVMGTHTGPGTLGVAFYSE